MSNPSSPLSRADIRQPQGWQSLVWRLAGRVIHRPDSQRVQPKVSLLLPRTSTTTAELRGERRCGRPFFPSPVRRISADSPPLRCVLALATQLLRSSLLRTCRSRPSEWSLHLQNERRWNAWKAPPAPAPPLLPLAASGSALAAIASRTVPGPAPTMWLLIADFGTAACYPQ